MISASGILGVSGAVCVFLSMFLFHTSVPREGKPPSAWTRTETRAVASAMLVLALFLTGLTLLAKAIF